MSECPMNSRKGEPGRPGGTAVSDLLTVNPEKVRLDISTVCQLECALCPTDENNGRAFLKKGFMSHETFSGFLRSNPQIRHAELASAGEALLNPEFARIVESAWRMGVTTSLGGGANLNDASGEALESLVRFGVSHIRISVDGVTEETYRKYRKGGNLRKVLSHIAAINAFKKKYNSPYPELILQFILFGHNEHELDQVQVLSRMLGMTLLVKLNRCPESFAVKDRNGIRRRFGFVDRGEFLDATGIPYCRDLCLGLWKAPQVNWDGRLLGCGRNARMAFADSVLDGRYLDGINNEKMRYARMMLLGEAPPRPDIPCSDCSFYNQIKERKVWYTPSEIRSVVNKPGVVQKTS